MFSKIIYKLINVVHNGDSAMYDRFYWLKQNLVVLNETSKLLDVGCGNGFALELGLKKGFSYVLGLSWSDEDIKKNKKRLSKKINFIKADARKLDQVEINSKFDAIINTENIEHIIDADKLIKDISNLLNDGGLLYLTTPNNLHRKLHKDELIKFPPVEDGGHVVRGYSYKRLEKIMSKYNLKIIKCNYITGYFSSCLIALGRQFSFIPQILLSPLSIISTRLDSLFFSDNKLNLSIALVAEKIDE